MSPKLENQRSPEKMTIVNRDAYRAFVNHLIRFNNYHANNINLRDSASHNRVMNITTPFSIDDFKPISDTWMEIASKYVTEKDPTGLTTLKNHFKGLETEDRLRMNEAVKEVYNKLSNTAVRLELGEKYKENDGTENMDYTYVAHDILELSVLAIQAYSDAFHVMVYHTGNPAIGYENASELAHCAYNEHNDSNLHIREVDYESKDILESPLKYAQIQAGMYPEEIFLNVSPLKRVPYEKIYANRDKRWEAEDKWIEKQNEILEANRRAEQQIRDEQAAYNERLYREQEAIEALHRYELVKAAFPYVPNVEEPNKVSAPFYKYYSEFATRMGIDEKTMNAQSILDAAGQVFYRDRVDHILNNNKINNEKFLGEFLHIHRHIRRVAYEAYVEKCINEKTPIDMDVPAREVLDLTNAIFYTIDPIRYENYINSDKNRDIEFALRAAIVGTGKISTHELKIEGSERDAVIGHIKEIYEKKDISFYTAEGDARFNSFTADKKSSTDIVKEAEEEIAKYETYTKNLDNKVNGHTAHEQSLLRKAAMDAAYALEKRIETRYATRLARFFRFISYGKQRDELARMKKVLGIKLEERIADKMKESRIKDLFVYSNDNSELQKERGELSQQKAIELIKTSYLNNVKDLPTFTREDFLQEEYRREERELALREMHEKITQIDEEDEVAEEDEVERVNEDLNAIHQEPQDEPAVVDNNQEEKELPIQPSEEEIVEEPEPESEPELLISEEEYAKRVREAKEKLFNDKVRVITTNRDYSESVRKKFEEERFKSIKENKDIFKKMEREVEEIEAANEELNSQIYFLQEQIRAMSNQFAEGKIHSTTLEQEAEAEAKRKAGFWAKASNAVSSAFSSQATKDAKKKEEEEKKFELDKAGFVVAEQHKILEGLKNEIQGFVDQVNLNNEKIAKLNANKWIYDGRANRLEHTEISANELEASKEVKAYDREIARLMENKESIIESGEGLSFDEPSFKKNLMETLAKEKLEAANEKAPDGEVKSNEAEQEKREHIEVNNLDGNKNAPTEPKVEEIEKKEVSLEK